MNVLAHRRNQPERCHAYHLYSTDTDAMKIAGLLDRRLTITGQMFTIGYDWFEHATLSGTGLRSLTWRGHGGTIRTNVLRTNVRIQLL